MKKIFITILFFLCFFSSCEKECDCNDSFIYPCANENLIEEDSNSQKIGVTEVELFFYFLYDYIDENVQKVSISMIYVHEYDKDNRKLYTNIFYNQSERLLFKLLPSTKYFKVEMDGICSYDFNGYVSTYGHKWVSKIFSPEKKGVRNTYKIYKEEVVNTEPQ